MHRQRSKMKLVAARQVETVSYFGAGDLFFTSFGLALFIGFTTLVLVAT
jgi:hypothetical protein